MANDPQKSDDNFKEKLKHSVEQLKKNEKVEEVYNFASSNTRDLVAYVLLIAGLILMIFDASWYGSTIIGVIFGLYFSEEILTFVKNFREFLDRQGTVRSLIIAATLVALFIAAPFLFIGAAIAIAARKFIAPDDKGPKS